MSLTAKHFSAAQIARALGLSDRAVRMRLATVQEAALPSARGQTAKAWDVECLPEAMRTELAEAAGRRGCPSVDELLADPPAAWRPPLPWHLVPANHQERATKLALALAPVLDKQNQLSGPDLAERAGVFYRQHFGNDLADDKLRYLMDRATKRDNGFLQFHRPELWLDDAAFHAAPAPANTPGLHDGLKDYLPEDRINPSLDDIAMLLHHTFRHFEALAAAHRSTGEQRALKQALVKFLYQHCPGIYRPKNGASAAGAEKPLLAVRQLFNRSLGEWIEGGRTVESLMPKHRGKCGRKGYRCEPCEKMILKEAAQHRGHGKHMGNVDLAVDRLLQNGKLCEKCAEIHRDKRMSEAMRRRVTPNALQRAFQEGREFVRAIGPTHHNEWETDPGDVFVIDDMTTNVIAWDEVDGKPIHGQCQLLYTEDEFSAFPLPFLLYFGAPNRWSIKRAIVTFIIKKGLPHLHLLTERGVFNNRMLSGSGRARSALHFMEFETALKGLCDFSPCDDEKLRQLRTEELGLRDPAFGLNIRHAYSPQAKTCERSFDEFQKRESRLPGYGGYQQRYEQSRAMQDFARRVDAGKEHPGNQWLHLSDLRKNYEKLCEEISLRRINGKRHRGRTPADLWEEAMQTKPLRKLPPAMEHLLATHRLPSIKVRPEGLRVSLDKFEDAFYFNGHTGPLTGRNVAVRINYDFPGFIHIEHPDTGEFLKVDQVLTRRHTATPEELAKSNAARRAHIKGALGEIGTVPSPLDSTIIDETRYGAADLEKGRVIGEATEQHREEQAREKRERTHLARKAGVLGSVVPSKHSNLNRLKEGIELEVEARAEAEAWKKEHSA